MATRQPATDTPVKRKSAAQVALEKLGLRTPIDLALHVPMRYEDETRVHFLAEAPVGEEIGRASCRERV